MMQLYLNGLKQIIILKTNLVAIFITHQCQMPSLYQSTLPQFGESYALNNLKLTQ